MALSREEVLAELGEIRKGLGELEAQNPIDALGRALGAPGTHSATSGGGPGDVFVASQGYKAIQNPDARPQRWTTGAVQVSDSPLGMKGTLLESTAGGPGAGGAAVLPARDQSASCSSRSAWPTCSGSARPTASQVRYVNEGTALSGAAGVAEAGVKPESTIAMSEIVEPVKKIATLLGISDEMLDDAPSIQSYLNGRLALFISIEEERQLLRGAGGNELTGLFNRSGGQAINTYTKLGTDDNAVALARVIANTRGSANLEPDSVVMHPSNWLSTRLLRDGAGGTIGQFYGGGPFTAAYGNPGQPRLWNESLWGKRVVLSTVVGAGTALVGCFGQGAHIWRRGGVSVEASNSHDDWFAKDLVALRAESRLALGLYRPSSFTAVSGLV